MGQPGYRWIEALEYGLAKLAKDRPCSSIGSSQMRQPSCVKNNIAFKPVTYRNTHEELQTEDDDGLLVENGKQQKLDINDNE